MWNSIVSVPDLCLFYVLSNQPDQIAKFDVYIFTADKKYLFADPNPSDAFT